MQVAGDCVEYAVGEGLEVGDGDGQTLLHLGVSEGLLSTDLIGQRTDQEGRQYTHNIFSHTHPLNTFTLTSLVASLAYI